MFIGLTPATDFRQIFQKCCFLGKDSWRIIKRITRNIWALSDSVSEWARSSGNMDQARFRQKISLVGPSVSVIRGAEFSREILVFCGGIWDSELAKFCAVSGDPYDGYGCA